MLKEDLTLMQDGKSRRKCKENGVLVPTVAEFRQALDRITNSISEEQKCMLVAHAPAGEGGLSAEQLSKAARRESYRYANRYYGGLAKQFVADLRIEPRASQLGKNRLPDGEYWIDGIAHWVQPKEGHAVWFMYHELRDALVAYRAENSLCDRLPVLS